MRFQNGSNKAVIELQVVQFKSKIILVISNRTHAARLFDFEITHMISYQIALHSVQLPLFIIQNEFTENKNRQTLSQPKPWCNDSGVLNLHHASNVKEVVSSQLSVTWYKSTNQKIRIRTVYES